MNGYLGSLVQRSALVVASREPAPLTGEAGHDDTGPHSDWEGFAEETMEITTPSPYPVLDPRVKMADAARVRPPVDSEPTAATEAAGAPPSIERHEARERRDPGSPPIRVDTRQSKEPPETTFERTQVWHETYGRVRQWVAASPDAEAVPESIERHDVVESPTARAAIIGAERAPAPPAAESAWRDPSAVPEIHVSIGTISVVVEGPAATPQAAEPTPRTNPAASSDWTRLRRLYIR